MKIIKFRYWDYDLKTFYYFTLDKECNFEDLEHILNGHKLSKPMAFTGLKDKNGRDSYFDSDLIKLENIDFPFNVEIFMIRRDKFGTPHFVQPKRSIITISFEDYFHSEGRLDNSFEIIGNIFENPELMQILNLEKEK